MNEKIAIIGAGVMGGAIIKSLIKSNYQGKIAVVDIQTEKLAEFEQLGVKISSDNKKSAGWADIIFIAVKPADVANVLNEIGKEINDKLVVSVAATVPLKYLKKHAPNSQLVRIMPNLCVMVQTSYTAYCCEESVTDENKQKIKTLLDIMGLSQEVDEKYMDAITAISGSGPGYLSVILEALTYAGLKVGLPRNVALISAAQTMMGTAKMVVDLKEEPAKIKDMTTTPDGTTIEAIYQIENSQIRAALMRAVEEATKKSQIIREKLKLDDP